MAPDSKPKRNQPTMFEKLGGTTAIEAVVDIFYTRVFADEEVSRFFEGINKQRLKAHQVLLPWLQAEVSVNCCVMMLYSHMT